MRPHDEEHSRTFLGQRAALHRSRVVLHNFSSVLETISHGVEYLLPNVGATRSRIVVDDTFWTTKRREKR